jgi:hypothetical protein
MSTDLHCVWVGNNPLSILELLSIKIYQQKGFIVNLWIYNTINNIPDGVLIRDANEIMPEDSIFKFDRQDHFGHGSVSHWSDIFQLKLLNQYGGWYSQLDVSCLKIPQNTEYYFAHHENTISNQTINTYIMQLPKNAPFLDDCIQELSYTINKDSMRTIDWLDSMKLIGTHVFKNNLDKFISYNTQECGKDTLTMTNTRPNSKLEFIHWCNAAFKLKNNPIPNSFYHQLLQENGLI